MVPRLCTISAYSQPSWPLARRTLYQPLSGVVCLTRASTGIHSPAGTGASIRLLLIGLPAEDRRFVSVVEVDRADPGRRIGSYLHKRNPITGAAQDAMKRHPAHHP